MPSIYLVCDGVYGPRGTRASRNYVERVRQISVKHRLQLWEIASTNFGAIAGVSRGHAESIDNFTRGMHVYRHDIGANHMVVLSQTEFSRRVLELGEAERARQAIEAAKSVLELTWRTVLRA